MYRGAVYSSSYQLIVAFILATLVSIIHAQLPTQTIHQKTASRFSPHTRNRPKTLPTVPEDGACWQPHEVKDIIDDFFDAEEWETAIEDLYCGTMITYPVDGTLTGQQIYDASQIAQAAYETAREAWKAIKTAEEDPSACDPSKKRMCNNCLARQRKFSCALAFPYCDSSDKAPMITQSTPYSLAAKNSSISPISRFGVSPLISESFHSQSFTKEDVRGICTSFCSEMVEFCDSSLDCSLTQNKKCAGVASQGIISILLLIGASMLVFVL